MGVKPNKQSNFVGETKINLTDYVSDVDKDLINVFNYIKYNPRFYSQNEEPTLLTNEFAFWKDLNAGPKYYIVVNISGTQKKVELL